MKITTLAAVAFSIALCGLAHADEPGDYAPVYGPQPSLQAPYDEGYYGAPVGPVPSEVEADQEIVRRRRVIVQPGAPVPPPIAGPAGVILQPKYGPEFAIGCRIDRNPVDPSIATVSILWARDPIPFVRTVRTGPRGEGIAFAVAEFKRMGYCRSTPLPPHLLGGY